jgi:hypothetical protein
VCVCLCALIRFRLQSPRLRVSNFLLERFFPTIFCMVASAVTLQEPSARKTKTKNKEESHSPILYRWLCCAQLNKTFRKGEHSSPFFLIVPICCAIASFLPQSDAPPEHVCYPCVLSIMGSNHRNDNFHISCTSVYAALFSLCTCITVFVLYLSACPRKAGL